MRITTGFDRPNLSYDVVAIGSDRAKRAATLALLREPDGLPAIVYAGTRKKTDETASWLSRELGVPVPAYHAGLEREPRAEAQRAFMSGETPVVVATNAFGMGVDKANVRTVIHEVVPSSLEAYYQEAGRAGRDGLPSRCVLLAENRDKGLHVFFINQVHDPDAKNHRWRQYREVWGYVEGETCRRAAILKHFGDRAAPVAEGRCCDVCDGRLEIVAAPPPAATSSPTAQISRRRPRDGRTGHFAGGSYAPSRRSGGPGPSRFCAAGAARWCSRTATTSCPATASSTTGAPTICCARSTRSSTAACCARRAGGSRSWR